MSSIVKPFSKEKKQTAQMLLPKGLTRAAMTTVRQHLQLPPPAEPISAGSADQATSGHRSPSSPHHAIIACSSACVQDDSGKQAARE